MKNTRPPSKQPIPSHAKRVFRGIIYDVYQWQQKLFDGSHTTFEKIKRPDTVNVIPITTKGKIILTQQRQPGQEPFISVPGGRIDLGETPLKAAQRELLEETGHQAKKFILWDAIQPLTSMDWAIYTFIAKNCTKISGLTLDAGEKIKLIEVTFEEFIKVVAKNNYRDFEIAFKILKLQQKPQDMKRLRDLFLG